AKKIQRRARSVNLSNIRTSVGRNWPVFTEKPVYDERLGRRGSSANEKRPYYVTRKKWSTLQNFFLPLASSCAFSGLRPKIFPHTAVQIIARSASEQSRGAAEVR